MANNYKTNEVRSMTERRTELEDSIGELEKQSLKDKKELDENTERT